MFSTQASRLPVFIPSTLRILECPYGFSLHCPIDVSLTAEFPAKYLEKTFPCSWELLAWLDGVLIAPVMPMHTLRRTLSSFLQFLFTKVAVTSLCTKKSKKVSGLSHQTLVTKMEMHRNLQHLQDDMAQPR
ncbi:hypothetical protein ACFFRR_002438 [Megaselia abdita]